MVREETKFFHRLEGSMKVSGVHLQPMFFNHLAPAWTCLAKGKEEYGVFTTAKSRLSVPSIITRPVDRTMVDVQFGWRMNEAFLDNCYAVVKNKVVDHEFADKKDQALVLRKAGLLKSILATFSGGSGAFKLESDGRAEVRLSIAPPVVK